MITPRTVWPAPMGDSIPASPPMYAWQRAALDAWRAAGRRGIVEAVTGTGKTVLGLGATSEELARGGQVAVLVPTRELLAQWINALAQVLPRGTVIGCLGDGSSDSLGAVDVLVAVVNSARDGDLRPRRPGGLLIADECHRYASSDNRRALVAAVPHRLGLSATLQRPDNGHLAWLTPYFGETCYRFGYVEARRDGVIAPFEVTLVGVEFDRSERAIYTEHDETMASSAAELVGRWGIPSEPFGAFLPAVSLLAAGDDRAAMVARRYLAAMRERRHVLDDASGKVAAIDSRLPDIATAERVLVFTSTIAAADTIGTRLADAGLRAASLHSGLDRRERRERMAEFRDGRLRVLAAPQILDEGIDVPNVDLAIVLGASRTRRQMIQRMGRVLRRKPDGHPARFFIIYVTDTVEDPDKGAHGMFLDEVTPVATSVVRG